MAGQVEVELRQISATTTEAIMGRHTVLIDRPEEKGGADAGPMGGQLFLASVAGCFMSNLLAAIRARECVITGVHAVVTGTIVDLPARFTALELLVTAESADPELLGKLVQIADHGCIMMNTLREKLDLTIKIGVAA